MGGNSITIQLLFFLFCFFYLNKWGCWKILLYDVSNKSDNSNSYKDDFLSVYTLMKKGIKNTTAYLSESERERSVDLHDGGFGDQTVPW